MNISLCCENVVFAVPLDVCKHMKLVNNLVEADFETFEEADHEPISFDGFKILNENIKKNLLDKVILFCTKIESGECKFKGLPKPQDVNVLQHIEKNCGDIFEGLDLEGITKLTQQSEFLIVNNLQELCCAKIASFLRNRSVEEIRTTFDLKSDFDQFEEEQIREENKWTYSSKD